MREHLEAIYDVSRLCARLEPTSEKIPGVLRALGSAVPIRSAILFDAGAPPPRVAAWQSEPTGPEPTLQKAFGNLAEAAAGLGLASLFEDVPGSEDTFLQPERLPPIEVDPAEPSMFVVLPLASGGAPFGALQFEIVHPLSEIDLGLLTEASIHLSLSIVRDRIWQQEAAARAQAGIAHRRLAFLAEASGIVNGSFDLDEFLPRIAHLAIRDMADSCTISVSESATAAPLCIRASRAPFGALEGAVDDALKRSHARVYATGKPRVASGACDSLAEPLNLEARKALRKMGVRSVLSVPLLSRRSVIGVMTLTSADEARYGPDDFFVLEDVARRISRAIEAARLFHQASRTIQDRDDLLELLSKDLGGSLAQMLLTVTAAMSKRRGEEIRADLEGLRVRTASLCGTLIDLLDSAKAEAHALRIDPQDVHLTTLMEKARAAVRPAIERKGVRLDVRVRRSADELFADPARLEQVLNALLTNAVDSSEPGGPVVVRAQRVEKHIRVLFADTGKAIPPEALPHVFDRFWYVRNPGMSRAGLGLPLAKGIVEAHGGMIWVESAQGKGSTFSFSLPVR